jgi:hypothetical protein
VWKGLNGEQQAELVESLNLEELARKDDSTFVGDKEFDSTLFPIDSIRYGGDIAALKPGQEHDVSPCYSHYKIIDRYRSIAEKEGPQVGPALNLIAFAIFAGLEEHLTIGGVLFELLRNLLAEDSLGMPNIQVPAVADMKCHEWCAAVPDLDNLSDPPLALIYTIAACPDHGLCGVDEVRKAAIEYNTIAAGHFFQAKIAEVAQTQPDEEGGRSYHFGAANELVRSVFARAIEKSGCDIRMVDLWKDGKSLDGRQDGNTAARSRRAQEIFNKYVESVAENVLTNEKKAIQDFIFREFYGEQPSYFESRANRATFRTKAHRALREAARRREGDRE